MQLRQTRLVEQYQDAFDALLIRIKDSPVGHAVSCFLSGLNPEIKNTVRMFKPKTLHDVYCLAKLQESTLASMARREETHSGKACLYSNSHTYTKAKLLSYIFQQFFL